MSAIGAGGPSGKKDDKEKNPSKESPGRQRLREDKATKKIAAKQNVKEADRKARAAEGQASQKVGLSPAAETTPLSKTDDQDFHLLNLYAQSMEAMKEDLQLRVAADNADSAVMERRMALKQANDDLHEVESAKGAATDVRNAKAAVAVMESALSNAKKAAALLKKGRANQDMEIDRINDEKNRLREARGRELELEDDPSGRPKPGDQFGSSPASRNHSRQPRHASDGKGEGRAKQVDPDARSDSSTRDNGAKRRLGETRHNKSREQSVSSTGRTPETGPPSDEKSTGSDPVMQNVLASLRGIEILRSGKSSNRNLEQTERARSKKPPASIPTIEELSEVVNEYRSVVEQANEEYAEFERRYISSRNPSRLEAEMKTKKSGLLRAKKGLLTALIPWWEYHRDSCTASLTLREAERDTAKKQFEIASEGIKTGARIYPDDWQGSAGQYLVFLKVQCEKEEEAVGLARKSKKLADDGVNNTKKSYVTVNTAYNNSL